MSSPNPIGPPGSPSWDALWSGVLVAVIGAVGVIGAALIAFWGVLYSQRAPQQAALNDAFSNLTADLQEERAQLIARISELEQQLGQSRLECLEKDGEIRGLKQLRDSLMRLEGKSDPSTAH